MQLHAQNAVKRAFLQSTDAFLQLTVHSLPLNAGSVLLDRLVVSPVLPRSLSLALVGPMTSEATGAVVDD
jgi:hypothetical protein